MKRFLTLAALVLLVACGADGEPQPPAASPNAAGVTISGDAQIGIVSR